MARIYSVLAVGFYAFLAAAPAIAVQVTVRTASGDTAFYAPPGDTVAVVVSVDAEGEMLTGVEVFLKFDPRLFQPLDGEQPAEAAGLLGDVLADTLLAPSDSLALVHYAEADLNGKAVSGTLFTLRLVVLDGIFGPSQVEVFRDDAARRISAYTVSGSEGIADSLGGVRPLRYRDPPPLLALLDSLEVDEDSVLVLDLRPLASDAETGAEGLRWTVAGPDSVLSVTFGADSAQVRLAPAADFNGSVAVAFSVRDPSGSSAGGTVRLQVRPVNDSPGIFEGALPDTLVLSLPALALSLGSLAADIDDAPGTLVWQAEASGSVQAVVGEGPVVTISAPANWSGEETVRLRVMDPSGASDAVDMLVVREAPLVRLPGDFNGDGAVDFADFLAFAQQFNRPDAPPEFDLTGDGRVNLADFLVFARNFGQEAS